jgi:hypothetical protein
MGGGVPFLLTAVTVVVTASAAALAGKAASEPKAKRQAAKSTIGRRDFLGNFMFVNSLSSVP